MEDKHPEFQRLGQLKAMFEELYLIEIDIQENLLALWNWEFADELGSLIKEGLEESQTNILWILRGFELLKVELSDSVLNGSGPAAYATVREGLRSLGELRKKQLEAYLDARSLARDMDLVNIEALCEVALCRCPLYQSEPLTIQLH